MGCAKYRKQVELAYDLAAAGLANARAERDAWQAKADIWETRLGDATAELARLDRLVPA